ncbi:HrpT family type III secretion system protein [Pectobacteriaceae bacterium CE70]|nr:HrpT family type III secretion system protein [Pectobacteriaceae bacterium C52]WJV68857.1 HrpT family type III secretion system protein [Pectobacteriaceae bacterium CE70]WJY12780.1 HrpT family type III secretion system protein [Pectobacteriaceae bacterium C80]
MIYQRILLLSGALLLSACSSVTPQESCTSVACRPQPQARQLVIWWQPDLRTGASDFTQVSVQ